MMDPVGFEPTHLSIVVFIFFRKQDRLDLIRQLKTTALDHSAKDPAVPRIILPYPLSYLTKIWWRKVDFRGGEASRSLYRSTRATT
jgi:hypothetical protein